jgi:SAM-dependent methyltransferase
MEPTGWSSAPRNGAGALHGERIIPECDPGLFQWHQARYAFTLAQLVKPTDRVLDVGCGEGYGAELLATKAAEVVGMDLSAEVLRLARDRHHSSNLRFVEGNAMDLTAETWGRFDVVTCFEVIEHVADPGAFLDRLVSVLRPDGVLALSTPHAVVEDLHNRRMGRPPNPFHISSLTPRRLEALLRERFRDVALYGQSPRGNRLYLLLKAIDLFHIRHRILLHSKPSGASASSWDPSSTSPRLFVFKPWLAKTAAVTVAVSRHPY